ncbi:hypothetical protein M0R72_20715 [Candidatus Pacearchaeota archaeon]|jgi:hypothetical protein|nr:hypothetical protein [Candidatus Pacearchaeota archaeon]
MRLILILFVSLLAAVSLASAYTPEQQNMIDGTQLSWKMATAYATQDVAAFNALADQWNAWVQTNFGQDPSMIMAKLAGPVDLQKPYLRANNTTQGGMVHAIDGSNKAGGPKYMTNDGNLLPESARDDQMGFTVVEGKKVYTNPEKVDYLGGI